MKRGRACTVTMTMILAGGFAAPTYAWDSYGHMMVAYVAYQKLTPQTKGRANSLIQLNPKVGEWANWVPAGSSIEDSNMMIFMFAATWPDEIKSDFSYLNDGGDNGNRPDGSPDAAANKGYSDKLLHKYWHFIDTPFTQDGSALPPIPTPNIQERIGLFRTTLSMGTNDQLKSYDLVWLLHLVGDAHQPLHCAARVSKAVPLGDHGGNLVQLYWYPSELHAFWDAVPGTGKPISVVLSAIESAKKLPKTEPAEAARSSEAGWVSESFEAAQDNAYAAPVGAGTGPFILTRSYKKKAGKLADKRIALAGERLANLLNTELK